MSDQDHTNKSTDSLEQAMLYATLSPDRLSKIPEYEKKIDELVDRFKAYEVEFHLTSFSEHKQRWYADAEQEKNEKDSTATQKRIDLLVNRFESEWGDQSKKGFILFDFLKQPNQYDAKKYEFDNFIDQVSDSSGQSTGNCFSMSVLYAALANRLGLHVDVYANTHHAAAKLVTDEVLDDIEGLDDILDDWAGLDDDCDPFYREISVEMTNLFGYDFLQEENLSKMNPSHLASGVLNTRAGKEKDPEQAKELLRESLRLSPDFAFGHINLGACYEQEDDLKTALTHYEKALEIFPDLCKALRGAGKMRYQLGDVEGGIELLKRGSVKQDPKSQLALAFAYQDQGDLKKAKLELKKAKFLLGGKLPEEYEDVLGKLLE